MSDIKYAYPLILNKVTSYAQFHPAELCPSRYRAEGRKGDEFMTLSAIGMVAAVVIFLGGVLYFSRKPDFRTRLVGGGATLFVAAAVGWFAWLAGTSA